MRLNDVNKQILLKLLNLVLSMFFVLLFYFKVTESHLKVYFEVRTH